MTRRGSATCQVCGQTVEASYVRDQGQKGRIGRMPLAVVTTSGHGGGKEHAVFAAHYEILPLPH